MLGVVFNQCNLPIFTTRQSEIVYGLLINIEQAGSRSIFRRHVRNGGPVTD